ncbi:MAG: ribosome silencing factor [Desulfotignum sp.]
MTDTSQALTPYLTVVFSRKPRSVTAIDVRSLTSYTDMLVIVEAGSRRQVTSLAEHVVTGLKAENIMPLGTEGIKEGEWALLDYGSRIIHIFETKAKAFYDLEGLWSDAPRLDLSEFE